jgi:hypothetical protein
MSQYGQIPDLTQWTDYGMGLGGAEDYGSGYEPEDWRNYGLPDYGAFSERMGIMSGEGMNISAQVTPELYGDQVVARTPLLELTPQDYKYVQVMKKPYAGMMALGDDGAIYEYQDYDGMGGFFSRIRKGIKKIGRRIRKGVRKVISKIPGGKYLIKLGKKIWKVAKKFVKPLIKFVGKYAAKLAPVAALIPGWGPAIAAGLYTAGKVANLMTKYGVKIKGAVGKVRKLKFKSGKSSKKFQKALKRAAKKEARRQKRGGKIRKIKGARIPRRRRRRASGGRAAWKRALMKKMKRRLMRRR